MSNPTYNIQDGIYNKLTASTSLNDLVTGIYDYIPSQTEYPYIKLGDMTEVPWDTFSKRGETNTTTIHVFSDFRGNKETLNIMDKVSTLLEAADFTVTGYNLVYCRREFKTVYEEEQGTVRHGVLRFRVMVRET